MCFILVVSVHPNFHVTGSSLEFAIAILVVYGLMMFGWVLKTIEEDVNARF